MSMSILWRAAVFQTLAVLVLSISLAVALPHSFFLDWGWIAGPAAWALCAVFTARMLALPMAATLAGAALAGIPSAFAVIAGLHWLGAAVAVGVFAVWCARLQRRRQAWT